MPVNNLPDELLVYIFCILLEVNLRAFTIPRSVGTHQMLLEYQAEMQQKSTHWANAFSLALVCRRWKRLVWKEVYKYLVIPRATVHDMVYILKRLRHVEYAECNGRFVRNLYLAPGSPYRLQYFVALMICWVCDTVENLTVGK